MLPGGLFHLERQKLKAFAPRCRPLPLDTSLYEYLRLLYLDPGMQIVLRGREVEQWHLGTLEGRLNFFAGDSLEDMPYKPALSAGPEGPKVPVHIGIRKFFNAKGEFALDETGALSPESRSKARSYLPLPPQPLTCAVAPLTSRPALAFQSTGPSFTTSGASSVRWTTGGSTATTLGWGSGWCCLRRRTSWT